MPTWLEWGLAWVTWLQGLGDWLTTPMLFFTLLGTEEFFLVIMPALLWCYRPFLGLRIGLILVTSTGINLGLKLLFGMPRPCWVSDRVLALTSESSYGLPSNHAQTAVAIWGRLAAAFAARWLSVVVGVLIFLISLSRVYLGAHFPLDIFAGWAIGGIILWLFLRYEDAVGRWIRSKSLPTQLLFALGASLSLLAFFLAVGALTEAGGRSVPAAWIERAAAGAGEAEAIDPASLEGILATTGSLFGLAAGGVLLARGLPFDGRGPIWQRVIRYGIGMIGVALIFVGLRTVFPAGDTPVPQALRFLRYAATTFWIAYLAPWTFLRLRLAS